MDWLVFTIGWFIACLFILLFNAGADARRVGEADPEDFGEPSEGGEVDVLHCSKSAFF